MKNLSAAVAIMLLYGCATYQLSDRAAAVQVHSQMSTLTDKCKNLGPVSSTARDIMYGVDGAKRMAQGIAREQVAKKGGDTLVVLNYDRVNLADSTTTIQGVALRCYADK